jgi:hypothetical protein
MNHPHSSENRVRRSSPAINTGGSGGALHRRGRRQLWRLLLLLSLTFTLAGVAQAHRLGESYIFLDVAEQALGGRFEIRLDDLNKTFALDANGDGEVSEQEYEDRSAEVQGYAESRLRFYHDEREHPVRVVGSRAHDYGIAKFALIEFEVPTLKPVPLQLEVEYDYLFDGFESSHRGLLVIENNPRTGAVKNETDVSLIFGPGEQRQLLHLDATPWKKVLHDFVKHGIWHIWIGFDHILFIISLLLPAVMVLNSQRKWQPVGDFKSAFLFVVKIITLFTIAHSVTLSLSALGIIKLPVGLVEAVIAASIIVVALNNIFPLFNRRIWLVVFAFGLFHGLGFANVLAPLGAERNSLLTALIGFNLGVEIGQLAIITLVFPLLYLCRKWRYYQPVVMRFGSLLLIAVASYWLVERTVGI